VAEPILPFKGEWFEAECPRCERFVACGETVRVKAFLGDDHVEVEHLNCEASRVAKEDGRGVVSSTNRHYASSLLVDLILGLSKAHEPVEVEGVAV
jgi:hypothetical protein